MTYLGQKVKGQSLPLKLIYSHCLIRLNIPSDFNDFGFNSFQKIIFFSKTSNLNALGNKFDLDFE